MAEEQDIHLTKTEIHFNKWIGFFAVVFSLIAIAMSIVALCSLDNHEFSPDKAVVSTLGIMLACSVAATTIVITWQIFKYINLKNEMQEIAEQAMKKGLSSFSIINEATLEAQSDVSFIIGEMSTHKQFDSHMAGFQKAMSCEDDSYRNYAIDYIFRRMDENFSELKRERKDWKILECKREYYLGLAHQIKHEEVYKLFDYIKNAQPVNEDGSEYSGVHSKTDSGKNRDGSC